MDLQNSRRSYIVSFHKRYKAFHGTRVYSSGAVLQAPNSDVRLHIPLDLEAFVFGHAHTGIQHFLPHIPEEECLVAPITEYHCVYKNKDEYKSNYPFKIMIPHCIGDGDALSTVRVRHGDIYKSKPFLETVQFEVDDSYITIYTDEFSQFICTSCERICRGQGKAFVFGNLIKYPSLQPLSSVRLYMCSPLYNIREYRKDIVEVEQRYKRSLVEEDDLKWDPERVSCVESILTSVQVRNEDFLPRQPIPHKQEWNQGSKTLMQKNSTEDMHDMFFCHLCKAEPSIVATFYFEHQSENSSDCSLFSGSVGMRTDSNVFLLQTFFAIKFIETLTEEMSRQQEILAEITTELITTDDELTRFGLHLGFRYEIVQQTRTNHPRSVEGAALHLACLWWEDGMATREEKVPILLEAVRVVGKVRLVTWVEEKLMGGAGHVDGSCVMGVGGIETPQGASIMASVIEGPQEASVVEGGIEDPQEASVVEGGIERPEQASVVQGRIERPEQASVVQGRIERPEQASVVEGRIERPEQASVVEGRIERKEQASVVQGRIERPEQVSVVQGRIERPEVASVMEGVMERQEVASVMVVDETEEIRDAIVPVRERFVGGEVSTYL